MPTVRVTVAVTVVFTATQVVATIAPRGTGALVAVAFSLVLFAAGSIGFVAAFVVAAGRSRDERVTIAGVVWLTGAAPPAVAQALRVALVAQCVVALVTAGLRPFSAVAFGILAPMAGLGCIAWYGARHGAFAPIITDPADGPAVSGVAADAGPVETEEAPTVERADPDDFDQLFRRRKRRQR